VPVIVRSSLENSSRTIERHKKKEQQVGQVSSELNGGFHPLMISMVRVVSKYHIVPSATENPNLLMSEANS
jgi:hypothetical protein